jgi:D-alanyl-D-alanine carboxypeptidase (penicillin-binding protein 5/6)
MTSFCYRVIFLGAWISSIVQAAPSVTPTMESPASHAFLLDVSTGQPLYEKKAYERMPPSSMTKIVTLYLLLDSLAHKDLKLEDKVPVSRHAARQEGSRMFLKPEQDVSVEDLLKGIVVVSGNDACTALSEFMAGSDLAFAEMMNEKAKGLGAKDTHFVNASGLPSPQHWSTCWDLARIAQKTIEDFPQEFKKYYSLKDFSFNGISQPNRNRLLKDHFADGMKTGKTDSGGYGIVASAEREGRRLILVINGLASDATRTEEAKRLLNWGFQFFHPVTFFEKGQKILDVPVWRSHTVPLVALDKIAVSLPRRTLRDVKVKVRYLTPLLTPIQKGQKIGILTLSIPNKNPIEFPLGAGEEVLESGIFGWFKRLFTFFKPQKKSS